MDARTVAAGMVAGAVEAAAPDAGNTKASRCQEPEPLPASTTDSGPGVALAPVSVVVPCFRCVETIAEAVASVAAQTLRPAEVLLVDDCSGDGTLECLHEVARSYPQGWVKVFAMPRNGGPSGARNRGWEHAAHTYVAFLDADDTWHPRKIELQMQVLRAEPELALLAHQMNVQPRSAPPPAQRQPFRVKALSGRFLGMRTSIPTASVVLRRDLPFRFDEHRMRAEDFMLWAQILLSGYRCATINQILASWHKPAFGAGGLSGDMTAMYRAAYDVRRSLHAQGLLSRPHMYLADAISMLRQARRRVIASVRRHASDSRTYRVG